MNFLSHFYLSQGRRSPYYTLGSVFPDLVRIHNNLWKIRPRQKQIVPASDLDEIINGWKLHLESDRIFHNTAFFREHTERIRKRIYPVLSRKPFRPFFLAHVSLELLLDHLLLTGGHASPADFYARLEACDPDVLEAFFQQENISDYQSFFPFYHNFCQLRYVKDYEKTANIAYAINQIGKRVWQVPFNDQEEYALRGILEDYIVELDDYMSIFLTIERAIGGKQNTGSV